MLGTFLAEVGLQSTLRGPGFASGEIVLHSDWIKLLDQVEALSPIHLFVGENLVRTSFLGLDPNHLVRLQRILYHYQMIEKIGDIIVFKKIE